MSEYSPPDLQNDWNEVLKEEFYKEYFLKLREFVANERKFHGPIYPKPADVFHAFRLTPYSKVKVVIVGQDPYHGQNQAHGLCFSVLPGVPFPPSLNNIFKELKEDIGIPIPKNGCLDAWAAQGVLLLNATLTVREGKPMSHQAQGWEHFTDAVISKLNTREEPIIFVLWGKWAQNKIMNVLNDTKETKHEILQAAHPSPFSVHRGFFGCKHFSIINERLRARNITPIDWVLP